MPDNARRRLTNGQSADVDEVTSAAFSPDGTQIVTGSDDGTARVWAARGGPALAVLEGHDDAVYSAAFSPGGTQIVTGSGDTTARVWAVPEMLLASPRRQVEIACTKLADAGPLAFTAGDLADYPVLEGQPRDPKTGDFLSPCRGVLPAEVIAANYARWSRKAAKDETAPSE
jgi:hypothetical protein